MNKYTPGSWIAESDGEYWNVIVEGGEGFGREIVGCEGLYRCDGSDEANARLIAAAPDLLDALRKHLENFESQHALLLEIGNDYFVDLRDSARAAIAKATGEQA